jgi:hypothetical protein
MKLKNRVKRRSASATALADARYRVVKSAKVYTRKGKDVPSDGDSE